MNLRSIKSLWPLLLSLCFACTNHSFSELDNKAFNTPTPEAPRAPHIIWVQVPDDQPAGSSVTIVYEIIPGTSPVTSVVCHVDGQPVSCAIEGDTIIIDNSVSGSHNFDIVAVDENNLQDSGQIDWQIFDNFKKAEKAFSIADEDAKVDIMFIIDNSRSMLPEQASMAKRITSFMSRLNGLDWRIAVTTTDPRPERSYGDGKFIKYPSGKYWITNDTANAKTEFGKVIQRPETDGYFEEQGIYTSIRAIEKSLNPSEALYEQHKNFFRDQAALAIIEISDEDETIPASEDPAARGAALIKLVSDTWDNKKFQFHSIISKPGDDVCAKEPDHRPGVMLQALTLLTGGIVGSVCEDDYGTQLKVIGENVAGLKTKYELDCDPMDITADGKADVSVTSTVSKVPSFTITGKILQFNSALQPGDYKINYYCPK